MGASPYLVSTSPLTVPPGCGCCPSGTICCLCIASKLCADFTNPDWPSWGRVPGSLIFTGSDEIKQSVDIFGVGEACDTGVRSATYLWGVIGVGNEYISITMNCNDDGTARLNINLNVLGTDSGGNWSVTYSTSVAVSLFSLEGSCSTIVASTFSVPATHINFGTPPLPLASLSPCTLAISSGACGSMSAPIPAPMSAMATPAPSPARPLMCSMIGERIEFKSWCSNGWMCKHKCTSTRPDVSEHLGGIMEAVPGDDCQTCPGYITSQ